MALHHTDSSLSPESHEVPALHGDTIRKYLLLQAAQSTPTPVSEAPQYGPPGEALQTAP